nr:DNA-binding protein [Ectothiorhodospira haloalkaliphila]
MTYDDVVDTATAILKEGRNPSATAVIERLGRGSKSTAVKHLQTWRETLEGTGFALPRGIPESLAPAVERFWDEATQAAFAITEFDRQAFAQAHEELRLTTEQAQRQRTQAEREKEQALDLASQRERERKNMESRLGDAQARIEALEAEAQKRDAQHQAEIERLRMDHEKRENQWDEEKLQLQTKIKEVEDRLELTYERTTSAENRWAREVAAARDYAKEAAARYQSDRETLVQERKMAEKQVLIFAQERDKANYKAMMTGEKLEQLEGELKKLRNKLEQREQEIAKEKDRRAEAEAQAQQRQAEQAERIDALLQRLEKADTEDPDNHPLASKDPNS